MTCSGRDLSTSILANVDLFHLSQQTWTYKHAKSITKNKTVLMQHWCLFHLEMDTSYHKDTTQEIKEMRMKTEWTGDNWTYQQSLAQPPPNLSSVTVILRHWYKDWEWPDQERHERAPAQLKTQLRHNNLLEFLTSYCVCYWILKISYSVQNSKKRILKRD